MLHWQSLHSAHIKLTRRRKLLGFIQVRKGRNSSTLCEPYFLPSPIPKAIPIFPMVRFGKTLHSTTGGHSAAIATKGSSTAVRDKEGNEEQQMGNCAPRSTSDPQQSCSEECCGGCSSPLSGGGIASSWKLSPPHRKEQRGFKIEPSAHKCNHDFHFMENNILLSR